VRGFPVVKGYVALRTEQFAVRSVSGPDVEHIDARRQALCLDGNELEDRGALQRRLRDESTESLGAPPEQAFR
jgi:hypothetical protein